MSKSLFLCFLGFIYSSTAVPTPSKCQASSSECITLSTRSFLPLLADGAVTPELKPLDPLFIDHIESNSQKIRFSAKNVKVKGLRECNVLNVSRDAVNSKLNINLLCTIFVEGQYEIKGKILNLPLDSQGRLNLVFENIWILIEADLGEAEHNGQKHWDIINWDHNYIIKDKANVELSNLFNGSVKPTPEIKESLGSTLTELIGEIGPPVIKAIVKDAIGTVNKYFHIVPAEDFAFD